MFLISIYLFLNSFIYLSDINIEKIEKYPKNLFNYVSFYYPNLYHTLQKAFQHADNLNYKEIRNQLLLYTKKLNNKNNIQNKIKTQFTNLNIFTLYVIWCHQNYFLELNDFFIEDFLTKEIFKKTNIINTILESLLFKQILTIIKRDKKENLINKLLTITHPQKNDYILMLMELNITPI